MSFLEEIRSALQEKEKEQQLFARLITIVWIVLLGTDFVAYMMGMNYVKYGMRSQLRSYLMGLTNVLLIYLISFILGFLLSALIFFSILKVSKGDKVYVLGGAAFMASGLFDAVSAFYTFKVRSMIQETVEKLPLYTIDEMYHRLFDEIYPLLNNINNLSIGSASMIGLAFIFFGISALKFSGKLFEKTRLPMIITAAPTTEEEKAKVYEAMMISRSVRRAAGKIRAAGVIYLIVGVMDLLAFFPLAQSLYTLAFLLFFVGIYLESAGYRELRRIVAPESESRPRLFGLW